MEPTLAPIVLFVYNRPWHTQQTLEALAKNELAKECILYIYADGSKVNAAEETIEKIKETRACLKKQQWCKEVIIIEREINLGLANSIITGVTEIVNKHAKVIVLEDDIITSKGFLHYMNDALSLYEFEEKVWHISGYWYPANGSRKLPETFFFNAATCWGWATWKRAWDQLITNPQEIKEKVLLLENGLFRFNIENAYPFFDQLQLNIDQSIHTWAIKWYGSIFLNNALSLHPHHSLTNNIGFDGTGINCEQSVYYSWSTLSKSIRVKNIKLVESVLSRKLLKLFFNPETHSKNVTLKLFMKLKVKVKELIKKILLKRGLELVLQQKDEFKYLITVPRYTPLEVPLLGKSFLVADSMSFYYNYKEIFESEIYKFITTTNSPLIIDCGCNYGTSILYFKSIYPEAEIIGFEPDPYIFEIVKKNVKYYNLKNVVLYNKGLWSEETTLNFYSEKADGGRLEVANKSTIDEIIQVETTVLSKFLKDKKVDLLKMDIEGAEIEVLKECEKYLNNVTNIFIEYHSFSNSKQELDILLSILTKNKFRYQVNTINERKHPFINRSVVVAMDLQLNIFAFKD